MAVEATVRARFNNRAAVQISMYRRDGQKQENIQTPHGGPAAPEMTESVGPLPPKLYGASRRKELLDTTLHALVPGLHSSAMSWTA